MSLVTKTQSKQPLIDKILMKNNIGIKELRSVLNTSSPEKSHKFKQILLNAVFKFTETIHILVFLHREKVRKDKQYSVLSAGMM